VNPADLQSILPQASSISITVQAVRLLDSAQNFTGLSFSTLDLGAIPMSAMPQDGEVLPAASITECAPGTDVRMTDFALHAPEMLLQCPESDKQMTHCFSPAWVKFCPLSAWIAVILPAINYTHQLHTVSITIRASLAFAGTTQIFWS
jgi:hypothetical protein